MGAGQSKRSVDISGTPKKGDVANGAVATDEKLEKIEEGDAVAAKANANGSTTTTSTVTAEQQEAVAATMTESTGATVTESTPSKVEATTEEFEVAVASVKDTSHSEKASSPSTTTGEENKPEAVSSSPASPSEAVATEEPGSEKKKKHKKKWSFRSFSFSKKDKQKPALKEEKQQETVPEANENATPAESSEPAAAEQVKSEVPSSAKSDELEPPPLPKSPPPTPAEEVPTPAVTVAAVAVPVAAPVVAPVVPVVAATPEKEETPIVSEGDVDTSGGGEGLAEPIEDGELEESTATPAVDAPVTNGTSLTNGINDNVEVHGFNGHMLNGGGDSVSPVCERKASIDSVTAKIGSIKLQIASDNTESPAQNGMDDTSLVESNGNAEKNVPSLETAVVEN